MPRFKVETPTGFFYLDKPNIEATTEREAVEKFFVDHNDYLSEHDIDAIKDDHAAEAFIKCQDSDGGPVTLWLIKARIEATAEPYDMKRFEETR